MALLCIYVSLLAFIITFLSGVQNSHRQDVGEVQTQTNAILDSDEHVEPDSGSCTAVVALLHFFLLATFMWNSVYATQLVLLVRTMHSSLPPHWTPLSVASSSCWCFQGLQIFVLFTARKPSFRATVSRSVQYVASVNDMLHMTTYSLQRVWTGRSESESESYRDLRDDCTASSKTPKVSSPEVQDEDQ